MPNKIIRVRTAACAKKTSGWLQKLLEERDLDVVMGDKKCDAIVCYGWGIDENPNQLPILNATAGRLTNLQQLTRLNEGGIPIPKLVTDIRKADFATLKFPLLARAERHDGGGWDIQPVLQAEEMEWRKAAGAKYFTEYVPRKTEYRLWVYRRRVQATYEKLMKHPEKYKKIGANYEDGFEHTYMDSRNVPADLRTIAAKAVHVMGLDFGGVDILLGKDGQYRVLEVNSASGANSDKAVGLVKLADSIAKWVQLGFPEQSKKFTGALDAD
jgi:hypothetical protein